MTVRIENGDGCTQDGDKRQYMPVAVHWTCPECGEENTLNLWEDQYLSYPTFGKPYALGLYCMGGGGCRHEFTIQVVPRCALTLELVGP